MNTCYPLPIQSALHQLPKLIASLRYARPGCIRAMRPERAASLEKLLAAMLQACQLQFDGAVCALHGQWARPKTLQELADAAGLTFRSAKRALADLRAIELIKSKQIKRQGASGMLEVSPAMRLFTRKFWELVGLWKEFQRYVEWAKQHAKHKFLLPWKKISTKAKSTFSKAGSLLNGLLGRKSGKPPAPPPPAAPPGETPEARRVQENCERILAMLRDKNHG